MYRQRLVFQETNGFATAAGHLSKERLNVCKNAVVLGDVPKFQASALPQCDTVRAIFDEVVKNVEGGLTDPEPKVFLKELGGSSVDWVLRVWVNTPDFWAVHERLVRDAKKALDEAGIGIPFPQMDVHLDDAALEALRGRSA